MRKHLLIALLSLLFLCTGVGCSAYWYRLPEKFEVQNSRLNWVNIYYQADEDAPRIRCEMSDSGQIMILEGHSVTVGDDFNIEYHKRDFRDIRKYYYSMDPEMFRVTLQMLVDNGLLIREKLDEDSPVYPKVMIKANINHTTVDKFTVKEDLIAEIRSLLFQYKMSGTLSK